MQVAKWGNSLAIRLPAAVVEALGLREGDQIEIRIAGKRKFEIARDRSAEKAIEVSTHKHPNCHNDPRNGTPNTSREKPRKPTTSITSMERRASKNDARYCQRGMGEATKRLSSFFCLASTIEKPMPQIAEPIKFMPSNPGTTKSI